MSLEYTQRVFDRLGRDDPLYAVLTRRGYQGAWDPEEFFATGREVVTEVLRHVEELGLEVPRGRALDFGCGVGRLTQALAEHFDEVVGVDIAPSMLAEARSFDRHPDRVRYLLNTTDSLPDLDTGSFDFVYSTKTLQHIAPQPARRYVRSFMRVLRPGGVAVFQFHNGPDIEPGTLRGWLYHLRRHHLRRFWRTIRGRPPYEMHVLDRERVAAIVRTGGGEVVDVRDLSRGRPNRSLRFVVRKTR